MARVRRLTSTMPCMLTTCLEGSGARPDPHLKVARQALARQEGFTLISMVFILVVLAVLGAAMAKFSMRQQLGSASELAAARAMQSANAGLEWASFQLLRNPPPPSAGACPSTAPLNPSYVERQLSRRLVR